MFQDSYASLDPRMRAGSILEEPLEVQRIGSRRERQQRIGEMLDHVGLPARRPSGIRTSSPAASASALGSPAR